MSIECVVQTGIHTNVKKRVTFQRIELDVLYIYVYMAVIQNPVGKVLLWYRTAVGQLAVQKNARMSEFV